MALSKDLLDRLACPKCRGVVVLAADGSGLECATCELFYAIEDDIPNMLVEHARPLSERRPAR